MNINSLSIHFKFAAISWGVSLPKDHPSARQSWDMNFKKQYEKDQIEFWSYATRSRQDISKGVR